MKCEDVDIIAIAENKGDEPSRAHVAGCKTCRKHVARIKTFIEKLMPLYAAGRQMEDELEKELEAVDFASMKPLPDSLARKVAALREKSISDRLRKAIKGGKEKATSLAEKLMMPSPLAVPASPKDITKPRANKTQTKQPKGRKKT